MPDQPPNDAELLSGFEHLLDDVIEHPERRSEIVAQIHANYQQKKAVLVLDMCGFSRTTQQFGIVAFLVMIRRMRRICEPCFREFGGEFFKAEADNLLYFFNTAGSAVAAAREAQARIAAANEVLPEAERLFCAIGIGCGEILCIAPGDAHGAELNLAAKLGEDIARDGQILLTEATRAEVGADVATRPARVSVSGLELPYHEIIP